ncbi:MAG: hypothetical protein JWO08_4080 [Verrucomicrobiaceae bacterium]|nr:hypothetical protein [Verrucomicrobiaceae bacterium]
MKLTLCLALLPLVLMAAEPAPVLNPFWPKLESAALKTPEWTGEAGVDTVIILAIDDMRLNALPKYETFLRPIIDRLKRSQGKAPISIMTCTVDPTDPQLQTWLKEGLNFDVHTTAHPCPLLGEKGFDFAKQTVFECLDLLHQIPGNKPVAFRMPCCDSLSSPSPRFYAEIFPQGSLGEKHLSIDSSVMNLITPSDKLLPEQIVKDKAGSDRFAKYFPGTRGGQQWKQKSFTGFSTFIENYPYPYLINDSCWEFPCVVPSDWESYNVQDKVNPQLLEDWKAALDATVLKQGTFTLIFHPHGWSSSEQLAGLIDYAESKYGKRVKFMNFAEAKEKLDRISKAGRAMPKYKIPEDPLPEKAKGPGTVFVDLNGDGFEDIVVSNSKEYGIYLYNPVEKKSVQWAKGWSNVLREGVAGDANSIPQIVRADGSNNGAWFNDGAMWVQNEDTFALPDKVRRIPFTELLSVPGPAPRLPKDSLAALHLKPGFTATLVASEPLVQDPVFVDWDAKGRMWVVEMGDYPFAPGETTKDGSAGQGKVSDLQTGRIKILTDTDGDGVYDKATVFMDGLTHPTSLAMWKGGVIVASIPDIFYAEDTDGDGKCDKKEVWFTGFISGNPQHLVNGFAWGLDGWFYGANGDSGGDIKCLKTGKKVALGANDFRFNPQTLDFEIEAGRSQYGKWRDDWGNWFGNNNSVMGWHYYLPLHYLARNPSLAVKSIREVMNADKQVFPVSPPMRRFNWADATNTLTSGCCPMPYRDELFGDDGKNVMFVCEPANNLVHREVLNYDNIAISSHRHPADKDSEFIASEDNWFRPTMARTGPDGALYVVDMYRRVLEHPEWIPAEITKGLDIRAGENMGRIYRIAKLGRLPAPGVDISDPVDAMRSPNGWVRDTAMRLLVENGGKDTVSVLEGLAKDVKSPRTQVQALNTLALLNSLKGGVVLAALDSENVEVRVNAVRLAEVSGEPDALAAKLIGMVDDPSQRVRYQLALSAGSFAKDTRARIEGAFKRGGLKDSLILTALKTAAGSGAGQPLVVTAAALPVITNNNPDRQKTVQQYATAASLKGDAARGHLLYTGVCSACHKLKGEGNEIGPDLGTVAGKPLDQVIESILDPNRAVEQRYAVQTVTTKDSKEHVGLILEENGNNITLRTGTATELILLNDIAKRTSTNKSLMPDGLENVLKPQDVADVMAWIQAKQ